MAEILAVSLFFALGMSGWGRIFIKLFFKETSSLPDSLLFGIIFTSQIALCLHFFMPLGAEITSGVVLVGVLLFLQGIIKGGSCFVFPGSLDSIKKGYFLLIGLFSFILMAGYAFDNNLYSDVVAYHFPTMNWIRTNKIVFGLANLQDRLALNSIWYMTSSLSNPFLRWQSSMDYASIVLLWVYFISVFYLPPRRRAFGWVCRAVAFVVWGKATFLINLGLPATDLPSTLFGLLFYEKIIATYDEGRLSLRAFLEVIFIYIFAFQLKLSQVFLIFPLLALFLSFKDDVLAGLRQVKLKFVGVGFFLVAPWLLRSYILSGCWLFPLGISCQPSAAWGLPLDDVARIRYYVLAWARSPGMVLKVDKMEQWFPAWIQLQLAKFHLQVFLFSFVAFGSLILFRIILSKRASLSDSVLSRVPYWFFGSLFLIFLMWFFQGPDPRFIMGSFIFVQGILLYKLYSGLTVVRKYKAYLSYFLFLGLAFYLLDLGRIFMNSAVKSPWRADRFSESDRSSFIEKKSNFELKYVVPDFGKNPEGGCWLEEVLCANEPRAHLSQSKFGAYTVFKTEVVEKHE